MTLRYFGQDSSRVAIVVSSLFKACIIYIYIYLWYETVDLWESSAWNRLKKRNDAYDTGSSPDSTPAHRRRISVLRINVRCKWNSRSPWRGWTALVPWGKKHRSQNPWRHVKENCICLEDCDRTWRNNLLASVLKVTRSKTVNTCCHV